MNTETLITQHCGHCGHDIPIEAWLPDDSDHCVIVEDQPIAVETVHVEATGMAHIRATQNVRLTMCRALPWPPQAATPAAPPSCPECRQGKHPNCDGTTWDPVADAPAPCPCAEGGHQ